jgi:phosphoglycolate phosphatase-like HAD superfamily hydrolase
MPFHPQTDYLALDFDGVIADSISECLVVAHNAFDPQQRIDDLSELPAQTVAESRRLRNYIRSGEDYVYINLAMHKNVVINSQEDFDVFTDGHEHLRRDYFRLFYQERETFFQNRPEEWLRLNPLYPGMTDFLRNFQPKEHFYIITTKMLVYVDRILSAHRIDIQAANKFFSNSKRSVIDELLKKFSVSPDVFYFVDDQVDTLLKVQDLGVNCLLAAWGYNNAGQIEKAGSAGIRVIDLDHFHSFFHPALF